MTAESICAQRGIEVHYFDGRGTDKKGVYINQSHLIAVDAYLDEIEKKKVIYHELGHEDHDPTQYERRKEFFELQANRSMIHYLLKEELQELDNIEDFNYIRFMEKFNLNTIVDEEMIKEEFFKIIG